MSLIALSGCSTTIASDEIEWQTVAEGPIVVMEFSDGVYVSGYFHAGFYGGHGEIDSRGVIDYQYARQLEDGGIRKDLISTTYERFAAGRYPRSRVVTIYQDAAPDGSDARIEIFKCALPEELEQENRDIWELDPFGFSGGRHQLPDTCLTTGSDKLDRYELRVDIHVPPGSVVETFSTQDEAAQEDDDADG